MTNGGYIVETHPTRIKSWKELNEKNIIMQRYDYSCGAASLATLLRYYFKEYMTEQSLLNEINDIFDEQELNTIKQSGLSFLELEKICQIKGYQVASVRLNITALKQLQGPVLVFIQPEGYKHFAILRGVVEDRVFLADPSRGNIRMSVAKFLEEWSGETLIVGKKRFGLPANHPLAIYHRPGFRQELLILREFLRNEPPLPVKAP
ncbi:MAG: C39 family peptidase [Candidatus Thiodiazotropha sp.]